MKLLKMLVVSSILALVGCSSLKTAIEPMYYVKERCNAIGHTNKESLECMVKEMKTRDEARKIFGLRETAGYYENQLALLNQFDDTFNSRVKETQKIYEKEKESDVIVKQNNARDLCLILSDAQLQDAISKASAKGDYKTLQMLYSSEYRDQIVSDCIKEARK